MANDGTGQGQGGTGGQGQQGGAGTGQGAGGTQPEWTSGFNDDLKSWVANKGFKDPMAAIESYRHFEKAQGYPKERHLVLPESMSDATAMAAIWDKLGKPKEAKEYTFEAPPKESGLDEKFGERMREWAHKHNLTRGQFEGFIKDVINHEVTSSKEGREQVQHQITTQQNELKTKWGSAYEQNSNIASQAAKALGMNEAQVKALGAALGPKGALEMLHGLGVKLGEAKFISNGPTSGDTALDPAQARSQIKDLMNDTDFQRRLMSGDADAKNKWNRLHQQAAPGVQVIRH